MCLLHRVCSIGMHRVAFPFFWAVCPIIRAELEILLPWLSPSKYSRYSTICPIHTVPVVLLGSLESHLLTLHIDRNFSWAFWGNKIPCYLKILDCALSLLLLTARWSQVFVGGRVLLGGYWLRTGKLGTWWAMEISWWLMDWSVSFLSHCPHVHRRGSADAEVDCCTVLYCLIRMSTVFTSFPIFRDNRYTVT